jgi:hypothetical protein
VLLALSLTLGACANEQRPLVSDWLPAWNSMVAVVPSLAELGTPPDPDLCTDALAQLRSLSPRLRPTPDQAIDSVFEEWLQVAEDLMFECPSSNTQITDFEAGYAELARLEAEVAVVLRLDEGG